MKPKATALSHLTLSVCLTSLAFGMPNGAVAEQVELTSLDGAATISGDLKEFTGESYIVETGVGEMVVPANEVTCTGAGCPVDEVEEVSGYKIAGSDTVGLGLMPLLLSGFASAVDADATTEEMEGSDVYVTEIVGDGGFGDPLGTFAVDSTGSSDAFRALLDRSAELGMASRRIRPQEAQRLADAGAGDMTDPSQEHIVAIDSLIVVTNPENPVDTLTMDQLRGIYAGRFTNWSQVGGPDQKIEVFDRSEDSSTRGVFLDRVYSGNVPATLASSNVVSGNEDMAEQVTATPGSIGFVGHAFQNDAQAITLISECGISLTPDAFSARTEDYPLQRFLYLYNRGDSSNEFVDEFVDYAISPEADLAVAKAGFISMGVDRADQPLDGPRGLQLLQGGVSDAESGLMREMLAQMVAYDRLSTTFRFTSGSANLTPRGLLNLERLEDYLSEQPEGTKVLFVGFTDDVGSFPNNQRLSVGRATRVADEFRAFVGNRLPNIEVGVDGYGEVAPTTCNTTDFGRSINRRVEVWIQSEG